jgi:hypothetical protein
MADSNRLDKLDESRLETTLATYEAELSELKSSAPQYVNGSDVTNFVTDTGSTYDFTGTLTANRGVWLITATADAAATLYAQLLVLVYLNGALYTADLGYYDLLHPGTAPVNIRFAETVYDAPTSPVSATNKRTWRLIITGDSHRTISWKAYVPALDIVSITITRVS